MAAEEAVRRTVAPALETTCNATASALASPSEAPGTVSVTAAQASDALRQAWEFMPHGESSEVPNLRAEAATIASAMSELQHSANALREFQRAHRTRVLASVATGTVSANDATARVEALRRLEALARHARLCAEYLVEGGD